jgi:hypothetical protein
MAQDIWKLKRLDQEVDFYAIRNINEFILLSGNYCQRIVRNSAEQFNHLELDENYLSFRVVIGGIPCSSPCRTRITSTKTKPNNAHSTCYIATKTHPDDFNSFTLIARRAHYVELGNDCEIIRDVEIVLYVKKCKQNLSILRETAHLSEKTGFNIIQIFLYYCNI